MTKVLSDDEDIAESNDGRLLESLKQGSLPTELCVLYAISLIGEGGRNYIASKCIDSLKDLSQESQAWLGENIIDTSVRSDPTWQMFRRVMVDPLQRTAAFAFVADVLRKTGKEEEWASRLEPMFKDHIDSLEERGLVQQLLALDTSDTTNASLLKNQLMKVFLATARFALSRAENCVREMHVNAERHSQSEDAHQTIKLASSAVSTVTRFQSLLWNVGSDGSISSRCIEVHTRLCSSTRFIPLSSIISLTGLCQFTLRRFLIFMLGRLMFC